ncbi:Arylsulfatase precursor [Planctomycetes bacterium CA13]|uniref:Arylsulfatase n=1 Tax=Novipirellula herctigrandis TaxID=2527986 RepID=A0A5C5YYV2_9BACT|nr:Arylsulfatase precursor [Planctomycetes bacterium CA13]
MLHILERYRLALPAILIIWAAFTGTILSSSVQAMERPNVVLILIDDLSHYGVTAYGADHVSERRGLFENRKISTPSIDRLAKEGVRCDQAFAYPLCEPTRIALMSGQYGSRNFLRCKSQHASEITFGDLFKKAGYATGIYGKWKQTRGTKEIHAKDYIFEFGWDDFCCFDVVGENHRYIHPDLVINGEIHDYSGRADVDPHTGRQWYGPDICNRHALNFIEQNKDTPFFLYYPMLLVHDEHQPTPDTQPHSVFDNFMNQNQRDDRRFFPDMIAYMDKLIGKVVDKLDEHGLRENTVVIVMGDNGTKENFTHILPDGSEYFGGKGGNRDNGLHVPLIVSCPGTIPSGGEQKVRAYDGLVDVTDVFPTLCEAANIAIPNPNGIDGISFWPQLCGAQGEPRQVIYTWYNGNISADDQSRTLRYAFTKEFKRYAPHPNFPKGRFFDLRTDPMEQDGDLEAEAHFRLTVSPLQKVESREMRRDWNHPHRSGLKLDSLDAPQQKAFAELGRVIEDYRHVPVTALHIATLQKTIKVGETVVLAHRIEPTNATRQNVIWESKDPAVATVNKFGQLTAHAPGLATVTIYSWDDANPASAGQPETYVRDGIQNSISVEVQ